MAPLMAMEPSWVAGTAARLPLNEPIGVRTALTMTTSCAGGGKGGGALMYSAKTLTGCFVTSKLLTLRDGRVV